MIVAAGQTHLILGAGQAGAWAAMAMRQSGFAGRILLVGAEPGYPYERPPCSKALLLAEPAPPPSLFHPPERYAERNIEILANARAAAIEPAAGRVILDDGRHLGFDKLLIATGGAARRLSIPGGEHALVLRDLADARVLRAGLTGATRVVCIGAGVIGLEVAAAARLRGAAVTVLEEAPRPMGRAVSPATSAYVAGLHRDAGIDIRCSVRVQAIEAQGAQGFRVLTDQGTYRADCVVAGIGMVRNDGIARQAGIATENGILVDTAGRTNCPGIFAAGDVAAFPHPLFAPPLFPGRLRLETWRHAQNHGSAVARALCGEEIVYDDIPWFWTDQLGVNLQVAGLPALAVHDIVRPGARFLEFHLDAENRLIGATGADAPRDIRAAQALIRARVPLNPAQLADPGVALATLVRAAGRG